MRIKVYIGPASIGAIQRWRRFVAELGEKGDMLACYPVVFAREDGVIGGAASIDLSSLEGHVVGVRGVSGDDLELSASNKVVEAQQH